MMKPTSSAKSNQIKLETHMSEQESALQLACEILANLEKRFAWKTAAYLSKQLGERGCPIVKEKLECSAREPRNPPMRSDPNQTLAV